MAVITESTVWLSSIALVLWALLRRYSQRSPLDNIPGPPSTSFLHGHLPMFSERQSWNFWRNLAEAYGPVSKLAAVCGGTMLHVYDPKALHSILIKDVEIYPKHLTETHDLMMFLGPGVLTSDGPRHRRQRKMLNPVFSAAHLRNMTHIFYDIAHRLVKAMGDRLGDNPGEMDINGWMARTTLEMLGQAGLGYSFDDFNSDTTDAYGESLKRFFPAEGQLPQLSLIVPLLSNFLPESVIRSLCRLYPNPDLQDLLGISDTMARRSRDIIAEKKAALSKGDEELVHRVGEGKDLMSIILRANSAASDSEKLTDEEVIAQMSTFILAGMDTTSNALSRILHLLAQNPAIQQRLREEIVEAQGGAGSPMDIPYDDLVKLPYLDAICRETLRVHGPVASIFRRPTKDTVFPVSSPIRGKDGSLLSEIFVPKGTVIMLNLQASNLNKALWGEDASEWRPERWLEPPPPALDDARVPGVYSNLMSFSGGVRSCIGFKFSQLEMKVVLSVLLATFSFEMTDKPIAWNFSGIAYPTMGEESTKPEMVLRVVKLKA